MRILIVVHGYPPSARGGSEVYAEAHARTLHDACGDDVLVLTRDNAPDRPEFEVRETMQSGVRVVRINNTFRDVRSFEESYTQPRLAALASEVIDAFAPDVAHIHHLTCLSTHIPGHLHSRGVPCFMTLHDYWLLCHRGQLLDRDCRVQHAGRPLRRRKRGNAGGDRHGGHSGAPHRTVAAAGQARHLRALGHRLASSVSSAASVHRAGPRAGAHARRDVAPAGSHAPPRTCERSSRASRKSAFSSRHSASRLAVSRAARFARCRAATHRFHRQPDGVEGAARAARGVPSSCPTTRRSTCAGAACRITATTATGPYSSRCCVPRA
jgi:glycosyltransferase involved in cell wall biosynthesis